MGKCLILLPSVSFIKCGQIFTKILKKIQYEHETFDKFDGQTWQTKRNRPFCLTLPFVQQGKGLRGLNKGKKNLPLFSPTPHKGENSIRKNEAEEKLD